MDPNGGSVPGRGKRRVTTSYLQNRRTTFGTETVLPCTIPIFLLNQFVTTRIYRRLPIVRDKKFLSLFSYDK